MLTPLLAAMLALQTAGPAPASLPKDFSPKGADRVAIEALLRTYTKAVSTRDEPLFEELLLNREVPFSGVDQALASKGRPHGTENYESFRRGVFQGAPFTQTFRNARIEQDGDLAQVSVTFINSGARGSDWGFKTLQLLRVGGRWKIASEFFTNHG